MQTLRYWSRRHARLAVLFCLVATSSCSCQREENVQAKERLSQPPPPSALEALANEKLDASSLGDDPAMAKRINRMRFTEMRKRLGAATFQSMGKTDFSYGKVKINSSEKTKILAASDGTFSVVTEMKDGNNQELCYVNEIFFLKNRNGKWRASRDPTGERTAHVEDAGGIWRSVFDLMEKHLIYEGRGAEDYEGRAAEVYNLSIPDELEKAREAGKDLPARPTTDSAVIAGADDAGMPLDEIVPEESPEERTSRMDRVRKWRGQTHPAGGKGELWVDKETGVPLKVTFEGKLAVADGPNPSILHAKVTTRFTKIGDEPTIEPPKEAIEEVTRQKWPTNPRKFLEDKGLVKPLPKPDAETKKASTKKPKK